MNGETISENLDMINWIINQDYENTDNGDGTGQTYTGAEVQGAIWSLTNGASSKHKVWLMVSLLIQQQVRVRMRKKSWMRP